MKNRRPSPRALLAPLLLPLLAPSASAQTRFLDLGSLFDKTVAGGILMIPIGACSILLLAFALERALLLRRGRISPKPLLRRVEEALRRGDLDAAASLCGGSRSAFAAAIGAGLLRTEEGPAEVERTVEAAAQREITGMRKNLRAFAVITSVAPLLGLLGTVQGMIQVFDVVAQQGALGNASLLSGGISTALVTTFAGLTVAIPSLLLHQFFTARIQRFADEVVRVHHDALAPAVAGARAAAA
ncbi:MAG TPA: MotA/TolQ/ExbB proton channel family protein [Planctomycetota bacterium]|jgi:biopolymer transport protein ExbB|nr:MotA/TolQ/ExbB proton channel family protein [Planctomycetota bacterium]